MTDPWARLRATTQARIGLGRAGNALPTAAELAFRAAHAAARDAVHLPLDVERVRADLDGLNLGPPVVVTSQARDRSEYLRRPDLGRLPAELAGLRTSGADLSIVIADGLAPLAIHAHAQGLLRALLTQFADQYEIAPLVIATQARVALGDHVGAAQGSDTVLVLIGERPGLSVADSVGIYLTHRPLPGRTDAERNCVSNIHPPDGLSYAAAAAVTAALVAGARELGESGVHLKDRSARTLTGETSHPAVS